MSQCVWPGNVRQLRNAVEQAAVLSDGSMISDHEISNLIQIMPGSDLHYEEPQTHDSDNISSPVSIVEEANQMERQQIVDALVKANGNKKKAAALLGISRSKLYRRLEL